MPETKSTIPKAPSAPETPSDPRRATQAETETYVPRESYIGGFRVLHEIGKGGMGKVYKAVDPKASRLVAVKVMLDEIAGDPHARAKFLREARAQAAVDHENVMPLFQVEDGDPPFIVMPLLEGQTLADRLKAEPPLSIAEITTVGRQIAAGLQAAHSKGLIHRDVKPANVWLKAPDQKVLLLDFGLARRIHHDEISISGNLSGTPQYMSPEQARGENDQLDGRSDLFGLGVILYRMVSGQGPFPSESVYDVLRSIIEIDPVPIRTLAPYCPEPLAQLIDELLQKDREQRPKTAQEVADRLQSMKSPSIQTGPTARPSPDPRSRPTESRTPLVPLDLPNPTRPRRRAILLAIVTVISLLSLLLLLRPRAGDNQPVAVPGGKPHFAGKVMLTIWRKNAQQEHDRLELREALPLREGDRFRIEAESREPGYHYLLWIDPQGEVVPVYPWQPRKWGTRPAVETRTDYCQLPEANRPPGTITVDESGMETVLLLVLPEPLQATDDEIKSWFADLPPQNRVNNGKLVMWFDRGQTVENDPTRGASFEGGEEIRDPLTQFHDRLQQRFASNGIFSTAVSFAKLAKRK